MAIKNELEGYKFMLDRKLAFENKFTSAGPEAARVARTNLVKERNDATKRGDNKGVEMAILGLSAYDQTDGFYTNVLTSIKDNLTLLMEKLNGGPFLKVAAVAKGGSRRARKASRKGRKVSRKGRKTSRKH